MGIKYPIWILIYPISIQQKMTRNLKKITEVDFHSINQIKYNAYYVRDRFI